jgi:hypothetical protein
MRELTLDEIGVLLVKAVRKLSEDERKRLAAAATGRFAKAGWKTRGGN